MSIDVTDTQRLREQNYILFEQVPCSMVLLSADLRILRANQRVMKTFGDVQGRFCYEVFRRRDTACRECPAREVMLAAARETAAVAAARGVTLPFDDAGVRAEEVALKTSSNRSSMLQDIQRGAPTEIDAICGAVHAEGVTVSMPTPVNWILWHLVRARVHGARL